MGTKIQINSLEALERLIGGDSETEIEIRNSVVQEFTKKHLKAVAISSSVEAATRLIESELNDKYYKIFRDRWGDKSIQFTDIARREVSDIIKGELLRLTREAVTEEVRMRGYDFVTELVDMKPVEDAIIKAVDTIETKLTEEILTSRINAAVDERLRQLLNAKK